MAKPEKHIFVCNHTRPPGHPKGSCGERSASDLAQAFYAELDKRELFNRFQLTSTGCLGRCEQGPVVLIYPDSVLYAHVGAADITEIIDQHLLGGKTVDRLLAPEESWG